MAAVGVVPVWHQESSAKINSHRNICPFSDLKLTNAFLTLFSQVLLVFTGVCRKPMLQRQQWICHEDIWVIARHPIEAPP